MKKVKHKAHANDLKELGFLEALSQRCPHDVEILKALANLYTRVGRCEDGLKTDQELSRVCPQDPLVWYNLACSYALMNLTDNALASLSLAVDLGYSDTGWMSQDTDLDSVRHDKRFRALLRCINPES